MGIFNPILYKMFKSPINLSDQKNKTPANSIKNKEIEIKEIEINTDTDIIKKKENKKLLNNKKNEETMEEEIDEIKINEEKELEKIDMKQMTIKLLEKKEMKYIIFYKLHKGYPTKKCMEIRYDHFKQIAEYLLNKYK